MADADWITITKAADLIYERHFATFGDFLLTMRQVWMLLEHRLHCGDLAARPRSPEDYSCEFTGGTGRSVFALSADGSIPSGFWYHYCEAAELKPLLATIVTGTHASRTGDDFHFTHEGLIEDGRLEGRAEGVVVHVAGLENLLARRGRPAGSAIDDAAIVEEAYAAIRAGSLKPTQAVAQFAPHMPGGATLESKKARLRLRLKDRGEKFRD